MLLDAEWLNAKCLRIELAVRSGREDSRKSSIAFVSARRLSLPLVFQCDVWRAIDYSQLATRPASHEPDFNEFTESLCLHIGAITAKS